MNINVLYLLPSLCFPTIVEYMDDRKGDENKTQDVKTRALYMLMAALPAIAILDDPYWLALLKGLAAAFGIFCGFFDYFIAYVFNHKWFQYLGKMGKFDNSPLWQKAGKYGRFAVKVAIFVSTMWFYLS